MEADQFIAEMARGVHDERLVDIHNAVIKRHIDGAVRFAWAIDLDTLDIVGSVHVSELTIRLEEVEEVEEQLRIPMTAIDPMKNARHLAAILRARMKHTHGLGPDDVAKAMGSLPPLDELIDRVSQIQRNPDPKGTPDGESRNQT